jgi:hypothetical protein
MSQIYGWGDSVGKMSALCNSYQFNIILNKITSYFIGFKRCFYSSYREEKAQNSQCNIGSEEKVKGLTPPNFKIYYEVTVFKQV